MLTRQSTYAELVAGFSWHIPPRFNIGVDTCDKWADGSGRLALIYERNDGTQARYTFDDIKARSNQLANSMRRQGVERGDRIGIFLPQTPETALAHIAAYKLGAVAVPLFALFGMEALQYRLSNCGATALVTDRQGLEKIRSIRDTLPHLKTIYCIDATASDTDACDFWQQLQAEADAFEPIDTSADDPAVIIYTSGTTGKPKGALHAHRVLLGHLPGVEMSHEFFPEHARLMWTPADWAWIGGLLDVLLPAWHHGVTVLARRFEKFDGEAAFDLMARHGVTHTFLPPTALKMMRAVKDPQRWRLSLRAVASGGESLGEELIEWGQAALGVTINEFYGQTECNVVLSSCSSLFPPSIGSIGKAAPGHQVRIVDDAGEVLPVGTEGNIAVRAPDPVMFLGYWDNPDATRAKYAGDYLITGDLGVEDADGFIRFIGRNDDVITSAGYRIGPGPIEDCLLGHPAVRMAAVIGVPDRERTEIVKAFVVLNPDYKPSDALVKEIQMHVKTRLAAHEYPREVSFVDALPMTTTGKIIRRALREAAGDAKT
ncbi:AMP-dependent synthetase [Pandoraea thiooxydans]|uniref:AMP-dependent synthetase n=1 Tax=Pandoraea thiooxydans TaxID=445709 RepID=A0A0G3ETJ5_9BURK|nr:acyl-CoA synthetase [Pandoraea thiooxydans]AKJ68662.1 AMP-dependent synthetase [Pandoraea thiooxydans]APR96094.1 AMP-dependent synthetase [Pandoraea thiooxydans]